VLHSRAASDARRPHHRAAIRIAAHEHFATLEKDASAKGFLLVAHEAHAAASK